MTVRYLSVTTSRAAGYQPSPSLFIAIIAAISGVIMTALSLFAVWWFYA